MPRSALVVVDAQNGFITEHSAHVVPIISELVSTWRDAGQDVVFTRYLNYDDSPFERIMGWSKLKSPPETDIVAELRDDAAKATAQIDKRVYTLFTDEGSKLADDRKWTSVFVCGIDTEVCVLKTAVDAFERGITAWLISDASASHSGPTAHDAGLLVAGKMIGRRQIVSAAEAIDLQSRESLTA